MLMGQVVHEGWLKKSPSHWSFWNKQWRRRYFVLCSGYMPGQCCLQYFKDETKKSLKGTINLQDCEQVDAYLTYESKNQKLKYDWIFDIRLLNGKVLFIAADSEDLMNDWVNIICTVCSLQKEDEQNHSGSHEPLDDHVSLEASSINPSRSCSFDSTTSPAVNGIGSNGSNSLLSAVPVVNKTISVNGGEINMTSRQGYIPLTDCISGPERPMRKIIPTATSDLPFDDLAPAVPPPPLPPDAILKKSSLDNNWDSNTIRPAIVVHSRAASNDSTTSSNNMQMSSDSDVGSATMLPNGSSASLSLSEDPSGDDNLSPRIRRPSDLLNAVPPPRPPKPRRNGPVTKEPNLHTPYRNDFVIEEGEMFPSAYDRPSGGSLQRPATGRHHPPSPISPLSSTSSSHPDQFNSLPRLRSSNGFGTEETSSMLASLNVNGNSNISNVQSGENSTSGALYSSVKPPIPVENYQNVVLSPPPRQTSHHSPTTTDKPPEIDRSLKPSRNRNRSSESTSPTMINAPPPVVQIHEQQPHIPPRLPDAKKKLPSVSNYYQDPHYDRPTIGVTRKASFTKKVQNGAQNNAAPVFPSPLPHKRSSDSQDTPPPEKPQIVYVEMDVPPATSIGTLGSFGTSSSTRPSTSNNGEHHANNGLAPPTDAASAAKHSYVLINHEKTTALKITKEGQERMYKGGTFERSQSKASVTSHHK